MPPPVKPENVLKRAQELIGVDQTTAALTILHEHVTSKRTRSAPIASLEPVMLLFVELCVDLKKGKLAKEGLYQYKNTAQNTNVGTIETVLKKFLELSEAKVKEAQAKSEELQSAAGTTTEDGQAGVDDLEASETPESLLLATISGEQNKDRTDRAVVMPWLRFLWESYRTVLDVLKNNARLEVMYQTTALQAFEFCVTYTRKTEFRRLADLLRAHVQNAQKYQQQMHAINLSDPDTLQRHLDTRFRQLNVAVELELWQEAFRSVEDIQLLMAASKRPAKNITMANYYEKLTRIFLVSENYLFHAAAQSRYYNLLRQSAASVAGGAAAKKDNPPVSESDMGRAASFVLLSALAIPVISTSRSRGALVDVDEARKNKNSRLTNLLGMATAPSRATLFKDALAKGLLQRAKPEIQELYQILEVDFHPLSICKKISPLLTQIANDPEMEKYIRPLQQVILTRLFQQLSQVYESVELKFVHSLAQFPAPYEIKEDAIEKFIMNGCKKGDLTIRLDHASGVLTFDTDIFSSTKPISPNSAAGSAESEIGSVQRLQNTPSEIIRSQLTRLSKALYVVCQYVDPSFNRARKDAKAAALQRAAEGAAQEHHETLQRRFTIEKKKEMAIDALQKKQRDEELRKRQQTAQLAEKEANRLAEEQKAREIKRMQDEQKRIKLDQIAKEIQDLKKTTNIDLGGIDIEKLDSDGLRSIRLEQLAKEKSELTNLLRITAKRIDHLERAFRKEELKYMDQDYEAQKEEDKKAYDAASKEKLALAKQKHQDDVALKHRLSRLVPVYEKFRKDITEKRHDEFEKRRRQADKELENAISKRKRDFREAKARERRQREEEERKRREAEEKAQREADEKAAREDALRKEAAERRAAREAEREKDEEMRRLREQREEEAIARRKGGARAPEPTSAPSTAPADAPAAAPGPRRFGGGTGGGWREREAQKLAGAGAGTAPPSASDAPQQAAPSPASTPAPAAAEPPKESAGPRRFVPPAMRGENASAGGSGAGAAPSEERWRPKPRVASEAVGARDGSPAERPRLVGGSLRGNPNAERDASTDGSKFRASAGGWQPRARREQGAQQQ